MTLHPGRVVKGAGGATPVREGSPRDVSATSPAPARVLAARVMDARAEATRLLDAARAEAKRLVAHAEATAQAKAEAAAVAARDEALAELAAAHLALRAREEARAERDLDRTVEIAVLLAERVVGEALGVDRARIAALAIEALRETRGARRVRIEASPADVDALAEALAALGQEVCDIAPNAELGRGSILVETELGRVDARLAPRLERLAEALREALANGPASGGIGASR